VLQVPGLLTRFLSQAPGVESSFPVKVQLPLIFTVSVTLQLLKTRLLPPGQAPDLGGAAAGAAPRAKAKKGWFSAFTAAAAKVRPARGGTAPTLHLNELCCMGT
jgi:hypothetical protein